MSRAFSNHKGKTVGHLQVSSPLGQLELTASTTGLVAVVPMWSNRATRWVSRDSDTNHGDIQAIKHHLTNAKAELIAYFRGELTHFNTTIDLFIGTRFQHQVWRQLQQIGYGERCSYQAIADAIGRPKAVRAVGSANGANPLAIILPCHRVVGKNGQLTGYAFGLEMKQYLLDLEQQYHSPLSQ